MQPRTTVPRPPASRLPAAPRAILVAAFCGGLLGMAASASGARYYTVTPCRLLDTRTTTYAPALSGATTRAFTVAGRCQISPTASAVATNVTVTQPSAGGHLTLFATGTPYPGVSTINFRPNQTRANFAIVRPGQGGNVNAYTGISAAGTVHLIVDVVGYFADSAINQPPQVSAGGDQTITLPATASLSGTATDDGLPNPPATLTRTWSRLSGPGTVTFGNANALATTASFSAAGTYVIRLSVSDSQYTTTDDLTITVNPLGVNTNGIARFLEQATFGPTDPLINYVQSRGMPAWLNEQFSVPRTGYPPMPLVYTPPTMSCMADPVCIEFYTMYLLQRRFFENALYANDHLRQRVAWTLHKLIVVSGADLYTAWWIREYLELLQRNAFGNYRDLLHEITLHPTMGTYLNMVTSTAVQPNENYAREVLQLFSIGTVWLNQDGTLLTGVPLPTYNQAIVEGFAKVFTGWTFDAQLQPGVINYIDPMVLIDGNHDSVNYKLVLPATPAGVGITNCADVRATCLPPGQSGDMDLNQALDNIFNHPNVGPYIAKHFIQHLVTSNPSPAYVGRVAAAFNSNGSRIRGDLKAVIWATLTDPEASAPPSNNFGKLKEPVLLVTQFLRAMDPMSAYDRTQRSDGYLNQLMTNDDPFGENPAGTDQDAFRPPSVFSYYPPEFIAPGTSLSGPEFGIYSAIAALRRANIYNTLIYGYNGTTPGVGVNATAPDGTAPAGTSIDLVPLRDLAASSPSALCDEISRRLMHGTMSASMKNSILTAVAAVPASNPLRRAQTALYLVATSSQFQVGR